MEDIDAQCFIQRKVGFDLNTNDYSYPLCSGARAPGLAADMHFKDDVIAFIGPACAFALEPVAQLAAYWNTPIITGMGDQVINCMLMVSSPNDSEQFHIVHINPCLHPGV